MNTRKVRKIMNNTPEFSYKSLSLYGVQCLYKKKYIFIYEPIENIKKLLKIRL